MQNFEAGTKVRVINESHRNNELGIVEEIKVNTIEGSSLGDTYYIRFKDGKLSSFFEKNLQEVSDRAYKSKTGSIYKKKGAILTAFEESDVPFEEYIKESATCPKIREVKREDVKSKHFIDWFFKLVNWVDAGSDRFPFFMITHNGTSGQSVYGYFNNGKLDAIIRIEDLDDLYELTFFCVNPSQQCKGIGQHLFQFVLDKFKYKKLSLDVYTDNDAAIHIYQKYGFKIIGASYGLGIRLKSPSYTMQRNTSKNYLPMHNQYLFYHR